MPVLILDTEQAALLHASAEMLEAALAARVTRADPENIISDSLKLQAVKLASVRQAMKAPEPPDWRQLGTSLQRRALGLMHQVADHSDGPNADAAWRLLRDLINAPGFPST